MKSKIISRLESAYSVYNSFVLLSKPTSVRNTNNSHCARFQFTKGVDGDAGDAIGAEIKIDAEPFEEDTKFAMDAKNPTNTAIVAAKPKRKVKPKPKVIFYGPQSEVPYKRAGIFPWGKSDQKGPEGEKVRNCVLFYFPYVIDFLSSSRSLIHF
jgi:hypothetical protein